MKKRKLDITQIGDLTAAFKKWKNIYKTNLELEGCEDLETLGGTVFAFAHLIATRQTIITRFCDEKFIETITVPEMADALRNRNVCTFYIWFEIHFVVNEEKTRIENIVCADHTAALICFIDDRTMLPVVLTKLMKLNGAQFPMPYDFSSN